MGARAGSLDLCDDRVRPPRSVAVSFITIIIDSSFHLRLDFPLPTARAGRTAPTPRGPVTPAALSGLAGRPPLRLARGRCAPVGRRSVPCRDPDGPSGPLTRRAGPERLDKSPGAIGAVERPGGAARSTDGRRGHERYSSRVRRRLVHGPRRSKQSTAPVSSVSARAHDCRRSRGRRSAGAVTARAPRPSAVQEAFVLLGRAVGDAQRGRLAAQRRCRRARARRARQARA